MEHCTDAVTTGGSAGRKERRDQFAREAHDLEVFMQEIEEDKHLQSAVPLYKGRWTALYTFCTYRRSGTHHEPQTVLQTHKAWQRLPSWRQKGRHVLQLA